MHRPPRRDAHKAVALARESSRSAHRLKKETMRSLAVYLERTVKQHKIAAQTAAINGLTALLREEGLPADKRAKYVSQLKELTVALSAAAFAVDPVPADGDTDDDSDGDGNGNGDSDGNGEGDDGGAGGAGGDGGDADGGDGSDGGDGGDGGGKLPQTRKCEVAGCSYVAAGKNFRKNFNNHRKNRHPEHKSS